MTTNLPPYPPDVARLLEAEQARAGLPAALKERMFGSIAATLGLPFGGPDGSGGPGGEPGDPGAGADGAWPDGAGLDQAAASAGSAAAPAATAASAGSATATATAGAGAAATTGAAAVGGAGAAATTGAAAATGVGVAAAKGAGLFALAAKPLVVAAFVAGAATGSVTTYVVVRSPAAAPEVPAAVSKQPAPRRPVSRPAVARQQEPPPLPASAPAVAEKRPPAASPKKRPTARKKAAASQPSTLVAERNLILMARSALARDAPADALQALAEHRRRFARGQLVEERAALTVVALVRAGDGARARQAAARFRQRYPASLLLGTVNQALRQLDGE